MWRLHTALVIVASIGYGQQAGEKERKPAPENGTEKTAPAAVVRRLEAVTWDPLQSQLTWVVSVWDLGSDMTKPSQLERYAIHVNSGMMESQGETRKFDVPEKDLENLMDIISIYAMRSTIWWEHRGDTDPGDPQSTEPGDNKGTKDNGDGQDKPKSLPTGKAGLVPLPGVPSRQAPAGPLPPPR